MHPLFWNFEFAPMGDLRAAPSSQDRSPTRIFVLDDDPMFVAAMVRVANKQGMVVEGHTSIESLDPGVHREYDVAILDYNLGHATGFEVAGYLAHFYGAVPTILVSQSAHGCQAGGFWPSHVKDYVLKQRGPEAILKQAVRVFNNQDS